MSEPSGSERMVGAILSGKWRLLRLLGEGGMGAVFEADGLRGEGRRAIKVLHAEHVGNQAVLTRFYAEAEAASRLSHPNIARVLEFATAEDGSPYLVMELLDGIPLAAYLREGVPHPPAQAGPIVYAILSALGDAHQKGVVHRDLKPENIFLVRDKTGIFQVKVLDFGIAKVMDAAGGMGSKTRTGMLLGTPGYMSPEQIKNAKDVDPRSDLWSVGVIFYEMLTGRSVFVAPTELAKLTQVLTTDPAPIDAVLPELAPWRDFFTRALGRDPNHRFQSAGEMGNALITVARGGVLPLPMATMRSMAGAAGVAAAGAVVASTAGPGNQPVPTHQSVQLSPGAGIGVAVSHSPSIQIVSTRPVPDSTLKAGEMPMLPARGGTPKTVALWVLLVLCALCLGVGLAVGFFLARA